MTPLARFFGRVLPARTVWAAVAVTYAVAILLVLLFGVPLGGDIIYIDLEVPQ